MHQGSASESPSPTCTPTPSDSHKHQGDNDTLQRMQQNLPIWQSKVIPQEEVPDFLDSVITPIITTFQIPKATKHTFLNETKLSLIIARYLYLVIHCSGTACRRNKTLRKIVHCLFESCEHQTVDTSDYAIPAFPIYRGEPLRAWFATDPGIHSGRFILDMLSSGIYRIGCLGRITGSPNECQMWKKTVGSGVMDIRSFDATEEDFRIDDKTFEKICTFYEDWIVPRIWGIPRLVNTLMNDKHAFVCINCSFADKDKIFNGILAMRAVSKPDI